MKMIKIVMNLAAFSIFIVILAGCSQAKAPQREFNLRNDLDYKNAKNLQVGSDDAAIYSFDFQTNDLVSDVLAYYKNKLTANGWEGTFIENPTTLTSYYPATSTGVIYSAHITAETTSFNLTSVKVVTKSHIQIDPP